MVAVALIRAPRTTLLPTVAVQLTCSCFSNIKEKDNLFRHKICTLLCELITEMSYFVVDLMGCPLEEGRVAI